MKQRVERWLPGPRKERNNVAIQQIRSFSYAKGINLRALLYNIMPIDNSTELYT